MKSSGKKKKKQEIDNEVTRYDLGRQVEFAGDEDQELKNETPADDVLPHKVKRRRTH